MNYLSMNFKKPLKLPPKLASQIKSKSAFALSVVSLFILIVLFILVTLANPSFAQSTPKRNAVYAELAGNGVIYSVNYDRLFDLGESLKIAPRIGIALHQNQTFVFPLEVNLLFAKNPISKNFAEIGLGSTLVSKSLKGNNFGDLGNADTKCGCVKKDPEMNYILFSRIGFRHQSPDGGFMYRLGFLLAHSSENSKRDIIPFGGLSLGYSF